jgi:hypothetical protein
MRRLPLILATLVCALVPALLAAQDDLPQQTPPTSSEDLPQNPESSRASAAQVTKPPVRIRRPGFYNFANRHPLTPRDVSMREAVQSLGIDKHQFVRCELKDGSHFIGGITNIQFGYFRISQGIMNSREINYSELKQPPQSVPAAGEHIVNGLKWTGFVAVCVVLSPIAIAMLPLLFTGVISD